MPNAAEIRLLLEARDNATQHVKNLNKELDHVDKVARVASGGLNVVGASANRAAQNFTATAASIAKAGLSVAVGVQLLGVLGNVIQNVGDSTIGMNARLETSTLQFETLTKDADFAKKHIKDLFEFAKTTPFETMPIVEASRKLEAFGKAALNNMDWIKRIGDTSAASGAEFGELSFWVGRAFSSLKANAPIGEVIMRLTELAVIESEAAQELRSLSEHGGSAARAWEILTEQFSKNEGAMKKQESTWQGLSSTFSDTIKILSSTATLPIFETLKKNLAGINAALNAEETNEKVKGIATALETGLNNAAIIVDGSKSIPEALGRLMHEGIATVERTIRDSNSDINKAGVAIGTAVHEGFETYVNGINWGEILKGAVLASVRGLVIDVPMAINAEIIMPRYVLGDTPGNIAAVAAREVSAVVDAEKMLAKEQQKVVDTLAMQLRGTVTQDSMLDKSILNTEADLEKYSLGLMDAAEAVKFLGKEQAETLGIIKKGAGAIRDPAANITGNIGRGGGAGGAGGAGGKSVEALVSFTLGAYNAAMREVQNRMAMAGGGSILGVLIDGIEKGAGKGVSPDLLEKLASGASSINETIRKAFNPADAYRFGTEFTSALEEAIATGSSDAVEHLGAVLTSINLESQLFAIGNQAAEAINQATAETAEAISRLYESSSRQIDDMRANRDLDRATRERRESFDEQTQAADAAFAKHQDQLRDTRQKEKEQRDMRFRYATELQRLNKRAGEGQVDFREIEKQRKEIMFNYQLEQEEMAKRRNEQRDDAEFEKGLHRSLLDFQKSTARSRRTFEDALADEAFNRQINRIIAERDRGIAEANNRLGAIEAAELAKKAAHELAIAAQYARDWTSFNQLYAAPVESALTALSRERRMEFISNISGDLDSMVDSERLRIILDDIAGTYGVSIPEDLYGDLNSLAETGTLRDILASLPGTYGVNIPEELTGDLSNLDANNSLRGILNSIRGNYPVNIDEQINGDLWDLGATGTLRDILNDIAGQYGVNIEEWMNGDLGDLGAVQRLLDMLNDIAGSYQANIHIAYGSPDLDEMIALKNTLDAITGDYNAGMHLGGMNLGGMNLDSLGSMSSGGATFDFRGATFYNLADFEDAVAAAVVTAYRRGGLRFAISPTGARGSSAQSVGVSAMGGV